MLWTNRSLLFCLPKHSRGNLIDNQSCWRWTLYCTARGYQLRDDTILYKPSSKFGPPPSGEQNEGGTSEPPCIITCLSPALPEEHILPFHLLLYEWATITLSHSSKNGWLNDPRSTWRKSDTRRFVLPYGRVTFALQSPSRKSDDCPSSPCTDRRDEEPLFIIIQIPPSWEIRLCFPSECMSVVRFALPVTPPTPPTRV